jgi:hypothetical protein
MKREVSNLKQRISVEQLQELSSDQKQRLREIWQPNSGDHAIYTKYKNTVCLVLNNVNDRYFSLTGFGPSNQFWSAMNGKEDCLPLLSTGQMIELLMAHSKSFEGEAYPALCFAINEPMDDALNVSLWWDGRREGVEFCDALWDSVKKIL